MEDLRKEYSFFEKFRVWFNSNLIVVYTVGKVGTLTICASLRASGFRHIHPHSLFFTWPGIYFLAVDLSVFQRTFYFFRTYLKRVKVSIWKLLVPKIKIILGDKKWSRRE